MIMTKPMTLVMIGGSIERVHDIYDARNKQGSCLHRYENAKYAIPKFHRPRGHHHQCIKILSERFHDFILTHQCLG